MKNIIADIFARKRKRKERRDTTTSPEFILFQNPKSPIAEAYRMLRTNIQYAADTTKKLKTIVVTSSGPREGKTTTVINLGCAFAQANKKVLIVDSDLRNVSFHRLFKLSNDFGLTSAILGQKKLDEVVHKDVYMPNLDILTSGPKIANPAELIASKNTRDLMDMIKKSIYDIVIFDSPPTLAVTDAKLLSGIVDGIILIVQSGKVPRDVAIKAKESLTEVGANILGVVLNNLDASKGSYYYYHYHKQYYSYYAKDKYAKEKPLVEKKIEQKPEIEEKPVIVKKKDLFIPDSFDKDTNNKLLSSSDNIVTILSEEEKKAAEQTKTADKKSYDKNSALGRKPVFFKDLELPIEKKKPDKQNEGETDSCLGKKNMFDDL